MSIRWKSELMLNQKHASVLTPGKAFSAVQSSEGGAIFLSIGTDQTFCMTREVPGSGTGWDHADQSSAMSKNYDGKPVIAKAFAVSQDTTTLIFDVALVITVANCDYLYLSLSNPADLAVLAKGLIFTPCPFDAQGRNMPEIADVFLLRLPGTQGGVVSNCFVDVVRQPGNPLKLLDRYYINTAAAATTPRWNLHRIPIDLSDGSVSSCLGQRFHDRCPGIYTFGTIDGKPELIYTPQRNMYKPDAAPNSAWLALPQGSRSITSVLDGNGCTNLFVAAAGGIYLWTADRQVDQAEPLLVVPATIWPDFLTGLEQLSATTGGGRTQVCGLNSRGELVYTYCKAGDEATPPAWSTPMPMTNSTGSYTYYLDAKAGNTVLFASSSVDAKLLKIFENPVTTALNTSLIWLPPTSYQSYIEYNSFTTHICIQDQYAMPKPNTSVVLTAATPVTVNINDKYHALGPDSSVTLTTDPTGTLTVIQETQDLGAAAFRVTIAGEPDLQSSEATELIRPSTNLEQTLSTIKSGDDLGKVIVTGPDGKTRPLIPSDVSGDAKNTAARAIAQLMDINTTLPPDGSTLKPQLATEEKVGSPFLVTVASPEVHGFCFEKGAERYVQGNEAMLLLATEKPHHKRLTKSPGPIELGDVGSTSKISFASLMLLISNAWEKFENFVITAVDGISQFVCNIGGKIYQAALDCYNAVADAIELVFVQIKLLFADLVQWLGFIFNWDDILRTHRVVKNLCVRSLEHMLTTIDDVKVEVEEAFMALEEMIDKWADLKDDGKTIGTWLQDADRVKGKDLPQANWGLYHLVSSAPEAKGGDVPVPDPGADLKAALEVLFKAVTNEQEYIQTAVDQLRDQVVDGFMEMGPVAALKKIAAIISRAFLNSAQNVVVSTLELAKLILRLFMDLAQVPIQIPIISSIYERITNGSKLSVLDVFSLVGAVGATVIIKVITGEAPYPECAHTEALAKASTWEELRKALVAPLTTSSSRGSHEAPSHGSHHPHHHRHHRHSNCCYGVDIDDHNHDHDHVHEPQQGRFRGTKDPYNIAQSVANIIAFFAGLSQVALPIRPFEDDSWNGKIMWGGYLFYVLPNFIPPWFDDPHNIGVANSYITMAAVVKVTIDYAKGYMLDWYKKWDKSLETAISLMWIVPSIVWFTTKYQDSKKGGKPIQKSDIISLVGGGVGAIYAVGTFMTRSDDPNILIIGETLARSGTLGYCFTAIIGAGYMLVDS